MRLLLAVLASTLAFVSASPALAGPPFLSDDPDPTPNGHYEVFLFGNGAPASGNLSGAYGLDFNYGASPDLQLSATLPINYDRPRAGRFHSGIGNVELAAKFRIARQESFGWSVAVFPRVFLPSASGLGDQHASFLLPVWVGKSSDNWSAFGGGGCALNRGGGSRDFCVAGAAYTRRVLPYLTLGGEVFHRTADVKAGAASTIAGVGAIFDVSDDLHVLGYWGSEIESPTENGRGVGYASVLFTF